jgi:adenine-specific DNA glycosylase
MNKLVFSSGTILNYLPACGSPKCQVSKPFEHNCLAYNNCNWRRHGPGKETHDVSVVVIAVALVAAHADADG